MNVLFAGLVAGATMFALTLVPLAMNTRRTIKRRIDAAVEPRVLDGADTGLRASMEGVFEATQSRLGKTRLWRAVESLVERGDLPLRTVEAFYATLAGSLAIVLVALALGFPLLVGLVLVACAVALTRFVVGIRISRRLRAFEEQLPDMLAAIASALRAGHSFTQALGAVAAESEDPTAHELGRVIVETRLGRPIDDALADLGRRMASRDLDFVLTAVAIQRQVGGSIAGLFDNVAETVRQRQQFVRKLRGLTAMGRASAGLLIAIPFGLATLLTLLNPGYMSPLYSTRLGLTMVVAAVVSMAIGSAWLRKIVAFRG